MQPLASSSLLTPCCWSSNWHGSYEAVSNTSWFVLQAIYAAYAVDRFGLTAAGIGLTPGIYGAGMVAGASLAPRLMGYLSFGATVAAGPLCALLASVVMLSTLAYPSGVLAGVGLFLIWGGADPMDHHDHVAAGRDPGRAARQGVGRCYDSQFRVAPGRGGHWRPAGGALRRGGLSLDVGSRAHRAVLGAVHLARVPPEAAARAGLKAAVKSSNDRSLTNSDEDCSISLNGCLRVGQANIRPRLVES